MNKISGVFLTVIALVAYMGSAGSNRSVSGHTVYADNVPLNINNTSSYSEENADDNDILSYMKDFSVQYIKKGDINSDGVIDLTDLSLLSMWLVDDIELTHEQLIAADIIYENYSQAQPDIADLATINQIICKDNISLEFNPDKMIYISR